MGKHLGDYDASTIIYDKFTTYQPSTGAKFTLAGSPAIAVYKDAGTTESTSGCSITADFDSKTGLNHWAVDTSSDGTFYSSGSFFQVVLTAGTIDSVSVTSSVLASFTIRKNSALKPTTAARTLDVSTGGEAGVDWANIGSPTSNVNLSSTSLGGDIGGNLGGNVTGNVLGFVDSVANGVTIAAGGINAPSFSADAIDSSALAASAASEIGTAVWAIATRQLTGTQSFNLTGSITGNLSGSVGSVTGAVAALSSTSVAEPAGAPAASATLETKIGFIYEVLRNKLTVSSTAITFFNDAGSAQWSKSLTDDGTTYTEAEGA